ncbi:UDP-N-acetylglucosamine-N-acetylmuramylpentapeptide N-acetylglucosamine transferase [Carnobacterium iners]|uniref:UDP-N-acetylglucosamine--N-acetylmuramyl-(pentapeptide) pyrophosphoryl-undecaprenol N-acetylglucosamine transferase n=1 Tax=Carnobacterium iners TaxID=1073423 RepID=A0A1X7NNA2_9LACT|nr:undecaprenyldiphospho-muramoylpentapeptide beta-N-acetylglucosaminyltransferase [Carnobacterium iners]SEK30594.1 UDP-N-acetylglucosamine-N-acetylmuramylpentapeptide N-acetylglucosamine transferase [Carnobacterium iners]SMH39510.1 UDP-N-acetylglucosamine-N-acetylmuramylpentapeptide N-acetylglucosamine transferase [Carnobacterium iners]
MKIILSGGGTGGHIYPALALIKRIKQLDPTTEILYVGTEKGLESKIIRNAAIPFKSIEVQGFKRSFSISNFKTIYLFITSIQKSKKIIKDFHPDVVIGTGGYVCAPVIYAASKLKIPTIIHEQNSVAGVTNKFLARYVTKIAVCFEEARNEFSNYSEKVDYTGNPRAQEAVDAKPSAILEDYYLVANQPTVLIFGGSRGARILNEAFLEAVPLLKNKDYQVLFATGEIHYESIKKHIEPYLENSSSISVVPYIENMPEVFANVELVVSRSGATTLAELTALGLPSILVPSPYVTNDHQTRNAESLTKRSAAKMIAENRLSGESLIEAIDELMLNKELRKNMANAAKKLGLPKAADHLIQMIKEITDKKK